MKIPRSNTLNDWKNQDKTSVNYKTDFYMKPQNKINKYDNFIDKLTLEFSKIKNLNLSQEDETGKQLFNFIIKRLGEIHTFKTLFINYYLPAASKAVVDDYNEIQKSKYRPYLNITKEDLKENYYETIRLAYVGMFHKYENYVDDLIIQADLFSADSDSKLPISKYSDQIFQYKIKDWKNSPTINRLNWIAICNKHYDGYPRKTPKHEDYLNFPEDEKMKFTKEDFIDDIDSLISHYTLMLNLVFVISMHKIVCGGETYEINEFTDLELHQKVIDEKRNADNQVRTFIELMKQI